MSNLKSILGELDRGLKLHALWCDYVAFLALHDDLSQPLPSVDSVDDRIQWVEDMISVSKRIGIDLAAEMVDRAIKRGYYLPSIAQYQKYIAAYAN